MHPKIETLDVLHMHKTGIVAVYLIRHAGGALLVDCGPGSTLPTLLNELRVRDIEPRDVTDVLLTHIHLDHAGSAGWWAQQGARIHVHPVGAPHLLNPEKLLASAQRIYGDAMQTLWGDFLAVPEAQLIQHHDSALIEIGAHTFLALDTPGHAEHHFAYVFDDVCFSGDIGGVRVQGSQHIRPPTPPPEVHFEKWHTSLARLRQHHLKWLAPTHFGLFDDAQWHLDKMERTLTHIQDWTAEQMTHAPTQAEFRANYVELLNDLARADDSDDAQKLQVNDATGNGEALADGVYRYWKKFRA